MTVDSSADKTQATRGLSASALQAESDKKKRLKKQFSDGEIPTGAHFGELIDAFVLTEALDAENGVLQRLTNLERPTDGKFLKSVTIGDAAGEWKISSNQNGPLTFSPPGRSGAAWIRMPTRIGSLSHNAKTDDLPQIEALGVPPSPSLNRNFELVVPRPGPFAVEVFATVEPEKQDDGPGGSNTTFVGRLFKGLLRPPGGISMVRAVALTSGSGAPPQVDCHSTPLTTRRVALTRTISEFILVALLVFFLTDKMNTEIQLLPVKDDWFEKSLTLDIPDKVFCPVMGALAKVKLYTMPEDICAASAGGSTKADKTEFKPTADWLEQLTGQKTPEDTSKSKSVKQEPKAGEKPAATGAGNKTADTGSSGKDGSGADSGDSGKPAEDLAVNIAYSIAGLAGIALVLMLWLRTVPMWLTMRRGLSVAWIKDSSKKGGLILVLRRRGLLASQNAKVRYHMTQLWG